MRELIHLRKRHPTLRRRRFFIGELHRGDPARDRTAFAGAPSEQPVEVFPPAGPVRPGDAGLPPNADTSGVGDFARAGRDVGSAVPAMLADIHWHGTEPYQPDWGFMSRTLAFALDGRFTGREHDPDYQIDNDFYVAMNAWSEPLTFRIPPAPTRRRWRRLIDTARPSPEDIIGEGDKAPAVAEGSTYTVAAFSTLVLISEP